MFLLLARANINRFSKQLNFKILWKCLIMKNPLHTVYHTLLEVNIANYGACNSCNNSSPDVHWNISKIYLIIFHDLITVFIQVQTVKGLIGHTNNTKWLPSWSLLLQTKIFSFSWCHKHMLSSNCFPEIL